MVASTNLLGLGLYTPAEAAFYARITPRTMSYWMYGSGDHAPVVEPQLGKGEKIVTFLDFVQALAIRAIRREHGVSLQKIREAVHKAQTNYHVDYPFARQHTTYLLVREEQAEARRKNLENNCEVLICLNGDEGQMVQLTGRKAGNMVMRQVVELYLHHLNFGSDGLATVYKAWEQKDLVVTMDPKRRFGEPLLPSGYTVQTMSDAVLSEGSIEAAARAYGVDRKEVELACSYIDYLQGPSAA